MGLSRTKTILLCWGSINPKTHKPWKHDKTYFAEILTKEVEKTISKNLPNQCSLAIDGWSKGSTQFVGVFAAYTKPNEKGYSSVLLSFSPMVDEKSFTAQDHYEHLTYYVCLERIQDVRKCRANHWGQCCYEQTNCWSLCGQICWMCISKFVCLFEASWSSLGESEHSYGKTEEPEVGWYTARTYKLETHSKKQNSLVEHHGHGWEVPSTEAIHGVSKQRPETCWHYPTPR